MPKNSNQDSAQNKDGSNTPANFSIAAGFSGFTVEGNDNNNNNNNNNQPATPSVNPSAGSGGSVPVTPAVPGGSSSAGGQVSGGGSSAGGQVSGGGSSAGGQVSGGSAGGPGSGSVISSLVPGANVGGGSAGGQVSGGGSSAGGQVSGGGSSAGGQVSGGGSPAGGQVSGGSAGGPGSGSVISSLVPGGGNGSAGGQDGNTYGGNVYGGGAVPSYPSYPSYGQSGSVSGTVNDIANDLLNYHQISNSGFNTGGSSTETPSGLSEVESAILRSTVPIEISETEEISVNGQRGIWANRTEVANWRGVIPINEYKINEDSNPEVITKRSQQQLVYQQEVAIRYLRPPTPPAPGEIMIQQELNSLIPPAPPLIIRQQPPRPETPTPLVIREAPPQPPAQVGRKVITISGKRLPPPPRKVIIERLAPLPSKPQSVIIERWLPYSQVKRRVIFQKANDRDPVVVKPRNVIVQWEAPQVQVRKDFKDLGVIRANPAEYVARYGATLKPARELPEFVLQIKPPAGVVLAADHQYNSVYELEGDVQALRLIDLDREGLSEYKNLVQRLGIQNQPGIYGGDSFSGAAANGGNSAQYAGSSVSSVISDIFDQIDRDSNGRLSVDEASTILLRLNSRLGRQYGDDDLRRFFSGLDKNQDGTIQLAEFRRAFESQL